MTEQENKTFCPDCCKEIKLSDLLIGIGGCIYCPKNEPFTNSKDNIEKDGIMKIKSLTLEQLKIELNLIIPKAPFLSEGAISPMQVSRMGKREKAKYEKNVSLRFDLQSRIKYLMIPEEQRNKEINERRIEKINSKISSNNNLINLMKGFESYKSKRINSTKRTIILLEKENKELLIEKEGLNK